MRGPRDGDSFLPEEEARKEAALWTAALDFPSKLAFALKLFSYSIFSANQITQILMQGEMFAANEQIQLYRSSPEVIEMGLAV